MVNKMRKISAALMTAALFAGCSSSPKVDSDLELAQKSPHLAAIPSDTPYAFASLEPMPLGDMMEMMAKIGPEIDKVSDDFLAQLDANNASMMERFIGAYLAEFRGKYNRAGLESLGFSMNPRVAAYGIGWLPAFRYEVGDAAAFKAMVDRIEKKAGITGTDAKVGEFAYRAYAAEDGVFAMAMQGKEVIFGFTPTETADIYLPYLLGAQKPAENLLQTKALQGLVKKYDYKPYFLGFVDIERVVQMLIAPQPGLNEDIASRIDKNRTLDLSPACLSEFRGMASSYPRLVMGYDEWSKTGFSGRAGLEMTNGMGTKLAATKSNIPAATSAYSKDAVASFGLGVDMGKFMEFLTNEAANVRNAPYQCDKLAELNSSADQIGAGLMMASGMISDVKGVNAILKSVNVGGESEEPTAPDGSYTAAVTDNFTGAVVVSAIDSTNLLNTLKMLVPDLASLVIKTDGTAVQVPAMPSLGMPPGNYFIAMTPTQIGISAGQTAADDATELAKAAPSVTPWISLRYNPALLMTAMGTATGEYDELSGLFLGPIELDVVPNEAGVFFNFRQSFSE